MFCCYVKQLFFFRFVIYVRDRILSSYPFEDLCEGVEFPFRELLEYYSSFFFQFLCFKISTLYVHFSSEHFCSIFVGSHVFAPSLQNLPKNPGGGTNLKILPIFCQQMGNFFVGFCVINFSNATGRIWLKNAKSRQNFQKC